MACTREAGRIILWMVWVSVWLITSIYCVLAVIVFAKLWQAATEFHWNAKTLSQNKMWRGPLASLSLGAALTFGFNMMCCVTLIKKSVNRSGPGFGYGFMMAFSIALSMFLLLCGLVLDGFRPVVKSVLEPQYNTTDNTLLSGAVSWTSYSSEGFVGAEVLSLLSFVTYFVFGLVLIILQGAISDHLGINEAAGYGAAGNTYTEPIPTVEFKDGPAAPPDYDQYAQYEQYGSYAQTDASAQEQQQYYAASGAYQVGTGLDGSPTAGAYYNAAAAGYTADPSQVQMGYGMAPAMYSNTGYAAVGAYNDPGQHQQI